MTAKPTPTESSLPDGLLLKSAAGEGDLERVAAFDGQIHGKGVEAMTRNIFLHLPNTHLDDLIFVEEAKSSRVVSSLCLIPWIWRIEGIEVRTGEMGIVGTLEEYRGRGLIRAQVALFKQRLRERDCLLSQIQGIPYFYRQFGYEYTLPLEGGLRLETRDVPDPPDPPFTFHPVTADDLPTLARLYDEAMQPLAIHTARDEATWRYLLVQSQETEMKQDKWIVKDGAGEVAGYIFVPGHHFGEELVASEVSHLGADGALAVLNHLKQLALERKMPGIRLNLPANSTLMALARSLGGRDLGTYAWQIHVPDYVPLLRALASALERRVAASAFAGLTLDLRISLYRETLLLRFEGGKLAEVTNLGRTEGEDVRLPPLQFTPLLLGHRTWEELRAAFPDVGVAPARRLLVDALFPRIPAFLHTIY